MAGINNTQLQDEEQAQIDALRAELEQQIAEERKAAPAVKSVLNQRETARKTAAFATWEHEETRPAQPLMRPVQRRSLGKDALLLCVVTLGMGTLLGPSVQRMFAPPAPGMRMPITPPAYSGMPNFLQAPFEFTMTDEAGNNWNGSSMTCTEQVKMPDGSYRLGGSFNWVEDGVPTGMERFVGDYNPATGEFHVEGYEINQYAGDGSSHLVPGDYAGTVGPDGTLRGHMMGARGIDGIPGDFIAQQ